MKSHVVICLLFLFVLSEAHAFLPSIVPFKQIFGHQSVSPSVLFARDPRGIRELANYTLSMSELIYSFTRLRNAARDYTGEEPLNRRSLILTQRGNQTVKEEDGYSFRLLKYPVTVAAISEFIKLNTKFVRGVTIEGKHPDLTKPGPIEQALDRNTDNIVIKEFDDEFNRAGIKKGQLVYGITINKTKKRIMVVFRGTVFDLEQRDWLIDVDFRTRKIPIPTVLKRLGFEDDIKVHRGFDTYLNKKNVTSGFSRFDRIVLNLQDILQDKQYSDYSIYVSGHSLGASLAQYLSFLLAGDAPLSDQKTDADLSKYCKKSKTPITAITFASPKVGTGGFRKAYRKLEDEGLLRHIRISNAGDAIPVGQTLPGNYTQTGLNLYLSDGKVDVNYGTTKYERFKDARRYGMGQEGLCWWIGGFLKYHELTDYGEKLFKKENDFVLDKEIEDLYDEYKGK